MKDVLVMVGVGLLVVFILNRSDVWAPKGWEWLSGVLYVGRQKRAA